MRNEFPPIEENAKVIVKDLGADILLKAMQPDDIAQAISDDEIAATISDYQKEILLRVLLEQRFDAERAETILRDNGTT